MLTKPQVFYDDTHKQALGYQNPFNFKKAQRIKPTLYDGCVISRQHDVIPVTNEEEKLILEEVSRSKMLAKQNDPISKEKKINTTPINYVELNQLSEDLALKELSKVSLVNTSLKKLEYHLGKFDIVVKKRITPDAIIKGSWGFEHTKAVFLNECYVDKQCFKIHKKELFLDNDRILHQIMSQDVMLCVMNSTAIFGDYVNLEM
ncbi:hypothetical protein Tco_0698337 [Tanacetum coccineum]